ncbi:helix-turn-helix transcriptional regulator [Macrococcoides canis]|uniref:helix-turn-helix domain-containing protein n=1 Tax=Macrococcoides canis TaxID=1855823 RepID=UPI00207D67E6|nr:helix-turn-helix transcriptional regulator [Macrococcus canis]MCO4095949.1 helix-turn-helix transcriptional regulator [Macrococcus canis]UTH09422.1 helix-turn-helix transcriptional regulator [Macrococcus canis]
MKFGEVIKAHREGFGVSVKKFSDVTGVSTAYISKLENGKRNFPKDEIIFGLLYGFNKFLESSYGSDTPWVDINSGYLKDVLNEIITSEDSPIKDTDIDEYFEKFKSFSIKKDEENLNNNAKILKEIYENKIALKKDSVNKNVIEKPYYDLEWLLTQNENEVFYGRNFIFKTDAHSKDFNTESDFYFYNKLTPKDLNTIKNLIDIFLDNKYTFYKNKEKLFNIMTSSDKEVINQELFELLFEER